MQKENQKCYEFYVDGMHCAACELLIEKKLGKVKGVERVNAVLDKNKVKVFGNLDSNLEELADNFTKLVEKDGYTILSNTEFKRKVNLKEFIYAVPIALIFILVFVILQLTGFVNLISVDNSNYNLASAFILGLIASVSSCMAVVGGLSLSISASYAKESKKDQIRPQISFHLGRILGFLFLGMVVGLIGQAFKNYLESSNIPHLLMLFASIVMLILGINLLDLFQFTKKLQLNMPKAISRSLFKSEEVKNIFTPAFLGIATFFIPCGFTLVAQVQALDSQSMIKGGIYMLVFALGTFPALGLLSFASVNLSKSKLFSSGIFYKISGLIVIVFSLINLYNFGVLQGWFKPILNL